MSFYPVVTGAHSSVTLTGTASAQSGLKGVELFEGTKDLGAATIKADGTWSFDFTGPAGYHAGIYAVATDNQGFGTFATAPFTVQTGITGVPYTTVIFNFAPGSDKYLGTDYIKSNGDTYLENDYTALKDGGSRFTYTGGTYFNNKAFSSFSDTYDAAGNVTVHVENDKTGSNLTEIDADGQTVKALGTDTFANNADRTRFVFHPHVGTETIYGFQAAGPGHDIVSLPNSDAGRFAQILAHATDDGQGGTTLHLGKGDTITFVGVSVETLQKHQGDFVFHA